MRKLITYLFVLIAFLGLIEKTNAMCGSSIAVFPKSNTINTSGHIIIEAYGWGPMHEMLNSLGDQYPIYLNSLSGKVKLVKKEFIKGDKSWSQVLLIPESELKARETYELVVENVKPSDKTWFNINRLHRQGTRSKARWTAVHHKTSKNDLSVQLKSSEVQHFGCGPSVMTTFEVHFDHEDGAFILTEIEEEETRKRFRYYLVITDGQIRVGHGMCSGPYKFKRYNTYTIRFCADYSNSEDPFSPWVSCENPWNHEKGF